MDWTAMLWLAAIPISGYLLFMVLLRRGTERQPWAGTAAYVVSVYWPYGYQSLS